MGINLGTICTVTVVCMCTVYTCQGKTHVLARRQYWGPRVGGLGWKRWGWGVGVAGFVEGVGGEGWGW